MIVIVQSIGLIYLSYTLYRLQKYSFEPLLSDNEIKESDVDIDIFIDFIISK